jgi:sigma-70-like protein/WD40 repeat protein
MRDASNPILRRTVSDAEAREAFGELVRRYQGAATAYAYALLRNYSGAEDAAQAAFLNAWLHRHELRDPQAFGGWLRTIVRTECSRITRRASVTTVPIDMAFAERAEPSTDDGPDRERRQLLLTHPRRGAVSHQGNPCRAAGQRPKAVPVSVDALGRDRASDSFAPALSGNGNVVAFVSTSAARLRRVVFVRDLGWERAASIPCGGAEVTDADCYDPRLSADGRVVVFTISRDRGSGSTPVRTDIVVHDRIAARTVVITRTGNANSARARVSGNGRFVAFESLASNLPCNRGCRGESTDENLVADIYLFDRLTDTFTRVSRGGEEWWAPSVGAWLDGEGTSIAFSSRQPVDGNDPASDFDLFIRTLSPATITSLTR